MIITKDISLLDCGQQIQADKRIFSLCGKNNYLLLMSGIRSVVKICEKQYYMQPFTFILYPFDSRDICVETTELTAYRYMHILCTEEYLESLQETSMTLFEPHTIAQPLAVEEIWKLLLPFMKEDIQIPGKTGEYALRLMMCLLTQSSDGSVSRAAEVPHYDKLTSLRHKIYAEPANSWYIQDICNELGISRPYFHKLYMIAFGTTCTQDVIASRIAYSKKLLATTEEAIATISQKCGFETDVYFMRQFKRHVGMTPTAYRRVQSTTKKKS